ncbi:MAG: PqqD family peptide modification chaperone [Arenicella sp.]|nr:PqqD family peptide modification chaperone [Arenicella sp.]
MNTHGVKYYSLLESSGYGLTAISYLNALLDLECSIYWVPLILTEKGYQPWYRSASAKHKVRELLKQCLSEGSQIERLIECLTPISDYRCIVMHTVPEYWPLLKEPNQTHIGYSVWETSCLPTHFPDLINQIDRVLVPCAFNRPIFERSGVKIPIDVVPHILNKAPPIADATVSDMRRLTGVPIENYLFYCINDWTARKALWTLVNAYLSSFSVADTVSLVLKTSARGPRSEADVSEHDTQLLLTEIAAGYASPAHITVINHKVTNDDITALHQLGDCFVSTSHSEGWGLGMFEAAGVGNPVIATGWGGHLDFLTEESSYLSSYQLTEVIDARGNSSYSDNQQWARASQLSISEHLKTVFNAPDSAQRKAQNLALDLHKKYNAEQIGGQLYKAIMATNIPKIFHFIFGLKEQTEPFHLAYYLCLKSCIEVNKPSALHFYYHYQPYGEYWELIKPHLTLIEVELESFVQQNSAYQDHQEGQFIKASKLDYAHQADFIRLKKLIEYGGVYADMDTLFVNPIPDELYQHPFVIGREQDVIDSVSKQQKPSLCNALLMSEPNSEFARRWLEASYQSFDGTWSSHSCQQAASLASEFPDKVHVAPQRFFFKHMWTKQGIGTLFEGLDDDFQEVYSMHMWNHLWWDQSRVDFSYFHQGLITEQNIMSLDTTYNVVARRFLPQRSAASVVSDSTTCLTKKELSENLKKSSSSVLIPQIATGWELSQQHDSSRFSNLQSGHCFTTNEITNLIIEQCDGIKNVDSIIESLGERFPGDIESISQDVKVTLRQLALSGAISFKETTSYVPEVQHQPPPVSSKKYKLCIGMATYDDYDGVYFSVQAIRLYHPEILDQIEFVVLDNNPAGICADALKMLGDSMPNYRYIQGDNFQGTWSRFSLIDRTNAPYILCMDSHVMIVPGAIKQLLDYIDANPDTPDLLQGPLLSDDMVSLSSHFSPSWGSGMYGSWATDPRAHELDNPGFDIPMQGLGLFAFRKDSWPQLNPRFNGFGGEEGYVHEKVRRAGGRTLCLPFLRWLHRFNRPMGTRYALNWADRIRNYMIAHDELGIDNGPMIEHFNSHIGEAETAKIVANIESEIDNPFFFFDAIYCINLDRDEDRWAAVKAQFDQLGIAHRVRRFSAIETPGNHHIGCALSHRAIIQAASIDRHKNVLVLEDDVIFDATTLADLTNSLAEAKAESWDILYLGGHCWGKQYPLLSGCEYLREPASDDTGPTTTHAIVYRQSSYSRLLDELPDTIAEMARYVEHTHLAIDQYLAVDTSLKKLITEPRVVSQPPLLTQEAASFTPMLSDG